MVVGADPIVARLRWNYVQQPIMFGVVWIKAESTPAKVVGANTASQTGSLVSSLAFGQLVSHFGSNNLPFIAMAALCATGAFLG